jgi:hypothetical protein
MGWSEDTSYVDRDLDCYAEFANVAFDTIRLIERTLSGEYENSRVTSIGTYAFVGCGLTAVSFPSVVGNICQAFSVSTGGNGYLKSISYPNADGIVEQLAFCNTALEHIHLPKIRALEYWSMNEVYAVFVDFPALESFAAAGSFGASKLTTLVLRSESIVGMYGPGSISIPKISGGEGWVYVPRALVDGYAKATNWVTVANGRFRALEDYTVDGTISGELDWSKINGGE